MKTNTYLLTTIVSCCIILLSCNTNSTKQKATDLGASAQASMTQQNSNFHVQTHAQTSNSQLQSQSPDDKKSQRVGGDRDEHGCIASAGYRWSQLLKDCIRPFEKGSKFKSTEKDATLAAYLVFNADSTQVELFLPHETSYPILNRQPDIDGKNFWSGENEDLWTVRYIDKIWGIYYDNEIRFIKY